MKANPWIAAYEFDRKASSSFLSLERCAEPLAIDGTNVLAQAEQFKARMRDVFLCGEQTVAILEQLLSLAQSHASFHFASSYQVVASTYSADPWGADTQPALVLTGLSGVGKTQLVHALRRFLMSRIQRHDLPGHKNLPIVPAWFMSLRDGSSLNALVRPCLESADEQLGADKKTERKEIKQSTLLALARRVTRRDGTCLAVADEFQFKTYSSQANAQVTSILLQLMTLGPRFLFVCNYSLVHRLKERGQEDRQRLLAHPIQIYPEPLESPDFLNLLHEYIGIRPDDFDFSADDCAPLVHQYTFGIKRAMVELLGNAWRTAKVRRGARSTVTLDDIRIAYLSPEFHTHREDVESLWKQIHGDQRIRVDLRDPFPQNKSEQNVVQAIPAIREFERRTAEAHLEHMLTPDERAAALQLDGPKRAGAGPKGQVLRMARGKLTKETLIETLHRFEKT